MDSSSLKKGILEFVRARSTGAPGEYTMCENGEATLYSSCFAAMLLHYLGELKTLDDADRRAWAEYINRWQDAETGLYLGPEIIPDELTSPIHDFDHVTMHLAVHVLPALRLLGARPVYPLHFMKPFLDPEYLQGWLDRIDWKQAWLYGNELLFVAQLLLYLHEVEREEKAGAALDHYFKWLDKEMDPATGLWGTNGFCGPGEALYGGYHQLLAYYYCNRPLPYAERTIDTVLRLQNPGGGFSIKYGSGACEDIDAVDVLVNLYERTGYRTRAIRRALEAAIPCVLDHQMPDGGFVYRHGAPFSHLGIVKTEAPAGVSQMFATWFRVHTLALACQVLQDHPLSDMGWNFNEDCSMGWHAVPPPRAPRKRDPWLDFIPIRGCVARKYFMMFNPIPLRGTSIRKHLRHLAPARGLVVRLRKGLLGGSRT